MSSHVTPIRVYVGVFLALMIGTAMTTWIAHQDLGDLNTPAALLIATVKAALVILYFMHVKHSSKLIWLFSIAGFLWLLILFSLTLSDYLTRPGILGWE